MNKSTLISIGWPATLVCAFVVGKMNISSSNSTEKPQAQKTEVRTVEKKSSSNFTASLSTGQSPEQVKKNVISIAGASDSEFKQNFGIAKIMQIDDPIKRSTLLLGVLENMSDEDFERVVDDFRDLGITRERMTEYEQLLTAWAQRNPVAAIEYSKLHTNSPEAGNIILTTWAKSNPNAAIEWAKTNHDGNGANPYMIGVIKGITANNHVLATDLLNQMPYSEERGEALDSVLSSLNQMKTSDQLAWLETLNDNSLKVGATTRLIRQNPKEMSEWVTQLEDTKAKSDYIVSVANSWIRKEPEELKQWVSTLNPEQKMLAARGMIDELAKKDADSAAKWMNNMKDQDGYQDVLRSYIWSAATSRQPAAALAQVPNMQDEKSQRQVYERTLNYWSVAQPDEVEKWLPTSPVPDDIKASIVERIAKVKKGEITPNDLRGRRGDR
jgi:hypothetical protein